MFNAESNQTQKQQLEIIEESPVKTPAAGPGQPDAQERAAGFGARKRRLSPEQIAAKAPNGLPPIDRDSYTVDHGDPVRRAASRRPTLDNANMATTDNTVDVDGKGMEARRDASQWQDNVIYSNASLQNHLEVPNAGLGGADSRPGGNLPMIGTRPGWRIRYLGQVEVAAGQTSRNEHLISLERDDRAAHDSSSRDRLAGFLSDGDGPPPSGATHDDGKS